MTDAYPLDTNTICALADANRTTHESAVRRLQQARDFVLLPSPAVGEIEFGMAKAPNVKPDKRQILRDFIADFNQLPFDEFCVHPYALVRAELWFTHATPKAGRSGHKERHPEDLMDKVTGTELGIDEPDLMIASIAMAQNLVLVTDDRNAGMARVKQAAARSSRRASFRFNCELRTGWTRSFKITLKALSAVSRRLPSPERLHAGERPGGPGSILGRFSARRGKQHAGRVRSFQSGCVPHNGRP